MKLFQKNITENEIVVFAKNGGMSDDELVVA
jgi:hypothetical protein